MIKQIVSLLKILRHPIRKLVFIALAGLFEGFSFAFIVVGVDIIDIENVDLVKNIAKTLVIIFILRFFILLYANKLKSRMVYKLKAELQKNLLCTFISNTNKIEKVAKKDLDFAMQRFSIHSQEVSANYIFPFLNILSEIPLQIIILGVMFFYNPEVVLCGLLISFLLLLILQKITSSIKHVSKIRSENEGKAIKSFMFLRNNEFTLGLNKNMNAAIEDIRKFVDNGAREAEKGLYYQFLPKNVIESTLIILVLITSLIYFSADFQIDLMEVSAFIGVTMFRVIPGIYRFYSLWLAMKSTQKYVDEIQIKDGESEIRHFEICPKINLSGNIRHGFNVLTGDSGTGKSNFILKYINNELKNLSNEREIFYLDSSSSLYSGSLEENISYFIPQRNIRKEDTLKSILEMIESIKGEAFTKRLSTASDISEINLSSGEIKLILCLFGVHAASYLVILDEVTANLDEDIERFVLDLYKKSSDIRKVIFVRHGYKALACENEILFG